MNKEDIQKAALAFRYACEHNTILKRLDGTKEVYECFVPDCKERKYQCDGSCKKMKMFIEILKEPKQ